VISRVGLLVPSPPAGHRRRSAASPEPGSGAAPFASSARTPAAPNQSAPADACRSRDHGRLPPPGLASGAGWAARAGDRVRLASGADAQEVGSLRPTTSCRSAADRLWPPGVHPLDADHRAPSPGASDARVDRTLQRGPTTSEPGLENTDCRIGSVVAPTAVHWRSRVGVCCVSTPPFRLRLDCCRR